MEMPNRVLGIFNNFFGEERVDMQGFSSKTELTNTVLGLSIGELLARACMIAWYPIMPDLDKRLADIDFETASASYTDIIMKALSSDHFIDSYKNLAKGFILVHFPHTVITNEHNKSTVAKHIYIKVPITGKGTEEGIFTMNRSEYTVAELYSSYMHSHAAGIPTHNFTEFVSCCLGSGPLVNTQVQLSIAFDEDRWNLFCLELSKYIEVESLIGHPYHYLEQISFRGNKMKGIDCPRNSLHLYLGPIQKTILRRFLWYYLDNNNLTFSFRNGVYSIGMSYTEYLIHISNSYIEWVNKYPESEGKEEAIRALIKHYLIRDGELYSINNNIKEYIDQYKRYIGKAVCTFKGTPVTVVVTDIEDYTANSSNCVSILHPDIASCLLNKILRTINYRYGRYQETPNTVTSKIKYEA